MSTSSFCKTLFFCLSLMGLGACVGTDNSATVAVKAADEATLFSGIDLTAIDDSVRAQDDFHAYANGAWLKSTTMPAEYGRYGTFTQLSEAAEKNLLQIIDGEAPTTGSAGDGNAKKLGNLYASFMDTESIEASGIRGIEAELQLISAIDSQQQLLLAFADLVRMGLTTPFDVGVTPDFKDSSKYSFFFVQSGIGLPDREYYLDESNARFTQAVEDYGNYLLTLGELYRADTDSAKATATAKAGAEVKTNDAGMKDRVAAVIALERKLAKAHWSRTKNRNPESLYNPVKSDELSGLASFPWAEMLTKLGADSLSFVVIAQPDYVSKLNTIIKATPLSVWRDYLHLHVLSDSARYLPAKYADARFEFYGRKLSGLEQQKDRWRRAISTVSDVLGQPLGREYVRRHFPAEAKQRMLQMVENLLAEFRAGIDTLGWMSEQTKIEARTKLDKITVKIGYPDQWRDYSALDIKADDLLGNMQRSSEFEYAYEIAKLNGPIDKHEWYMNPHTVNAYYNPTMNEIVFPAGILQPPMFDLQADDAANYGAAGLVIGHEISHAFDDQGSRFDGDGNLRNWWTDEDQEKFKAATDKLVAQYSAFEPIVGQKINGDLTLGENIGDLSGASVAVKAYIRSLNGKPAPVIDDLTGVQRFFLGYARTWRTKYRDEVLSQMLVSDPHSPHRERVNGVVPNMPEFYQAFDVKPGDQHYLPPEQRVKVW